MWVSDTGLMLCNAVMYLCRWEYQAVLLSSKGSTAASGHAATALVNFVASIISPDAWLQAGVDPATAQHMAAAVVTYLARHDLFRHIHNILEPLAAPDSPPSKSQAETLATQTVVRYLALRQPEQPQASSTSSSTPVGLYHLLFTPNLWVCCPSLKPISSRMCRRSIADLSQLSSQQLVSVLPAGGPGGKAAAAAALLGNLLSVGSGVFHQQGAPDSALAKQFVTIITALLSLLPMKLLLLGSGEDTTDTYMPSTSGGSIARLSWPAEDMVPSQVSAALSQLSAVPGQALLKRLVHTLLPANSASSHGSSTIDASSVWLLSTLIWQLISLPQHRQRVLLGLAVSADFVARLWFSYLRPTYHAALTADKGGSGLQNWTKNGTSSQSPVAAASAGAGAAAYADPGWMLALLVLSPVFNSHMQTADLDEFYDKQQPLLLAEVYDPQRPQHGLVTMLKNAVWQVGGQQQRVVESMPNCNMPSCCSVCICCYYTLLVYNSIA